MDLMTTTKVFIWTYIKKSLFLKVISTVTWWWEHRQGAGVLAGHIHSQSESLRRLKIWLKMCCPTDPLPTLPWQQELAAMPSTNAFWESTGFILLLALHFCSITLVTLILLDPLTFTLGCVVCMCVCVCVCVFVSYNKSDKCLPLSFFPTVFWTHW